MSLSGTAHGASNAVPFFVSKEGQPRMPCSRPGAVQSTHIVWYTAADAAIVSTPSIDSRLTEALLSPATEHDDVHIHTCAGYINIHVQHRYICLSMFLCLC